MLNAEELAALERWRQIRANSIGKCLECGYSDECEGCTNMVPLLLDALAREHDPSLDELVTEEWLRANGFEYINVGFCRSIGEAKISVWNKELGWAVGNVNIHPGRPTIRNVTALIRLLGGEQ